MVAAWLKIATLVLKASPASKKQRPHRQNEFSEHLNASNADALTGAGGFCKKLTCICSTLSKLRLAVTPRFHWECLSSQTVNPFPAPATLHPACGFPALDAPVCFVPRFMGPILLGILFALDHRRSL
jgi:hypothetical protein